MQVQILVIGISVGIYCKERKISYMYLYRLKDVDRYTYWYIDRYKNLGFADHVFLGTHFSEEKVNQKRFFVIT